MTKTTDQKQALRIVTIPKNEYLRLLAANRRLEEIEGQKRMLSVPRSPIDRNLALRQFILDRAGKMYIEDLARACVAEFGPGATSRSSIHRFLRRHAAL
jgi:hypothetical protein